MQRQERGDGDVWSEKQQLIEPAMDDSFMGFEIEMRFSYPRDEGSLLYNWYHGKVVKVLNVKTQRVKIQWDEECLADDDAGISAHQLKPI